MAMISEEIQSYSSTRSPGFEDENLGSSPGRWAATVANYCPSRPSELEQKFASKHSEEVDE